MYTAFDENLLSKPDTEIALEAFQEERMILTLDVAFAYLRKYPPGSHPGIIVFRPNSFGPLSVNKFILKFMESSDLIELSSCIVIVEPSNVRVRFPEK
jgi:hypothetical protein